MEISIPSVDTAFLHGLTTQTDGLTATFFPPVQYKACDKEFVNQKGLKDFRGGPSKQKGHPPVYVDEAERRGDHQKFCAQVGFSRTVDNYETSSVRLRGSAIRERDNV